MQPHGLLLCFRLLHMFNSLVSASLVGHVLYLADLMSATCTPHYYLMVHRYIYSRYSPVFPMLYQLYHSLPSCQGWNPKERKWRIVDRNYTLFWSNVQRWRGMYLAMIEKRLRRWGKDIGAESDLLNDLGFNLCVAPRSPVVRLVAYFGVREVAKTEVPRSQVKELEWTRGD